MAFHSLAERQVLAPFQMVNMLAICVTVCEYPACSCSNKPLMRSANFDAASSRKSARHHCRLRQTSSAYVDAGFDTCRQMKVRFHCVYALLVLQFCRVTRSYPTQRKFIIICGSGNIATVRDRQTWCRMTWRHAIQRHKPNRQLQQQRTILSKSVGNVHLWRFPVSILLHSR